MFISNSFVEHKKITFYRTILETFFVFFSKPISELKENVFAVKKEVQTTQKAGRLLRQDRIWKNIENCQLVIDFLRLTTLCPAGSREWVKKIKECLTDPLTLISA